MIQSSSTLSPLDISFDPPDMCRRPFAAVTKAMLISALPAADSAPSCPLAMVLARLLKLKHLSSVLLCTAMNVCCTSQAKPDQKWYSQYPLQHSLHDSRACCSGHRGLCTQGRCQQWANMCLALKHRCVMKRILYLEYMISSAALTAL